MGCGSAKAASPPAVVPNRTDVVMDDDQAAVQNGVAKAAIARTVEVPKAVAFEVPLEPAAPGGGTGLKSQPPERLQKQRAADSPPITVEAIREKQAQAEQRRQEVLEERVRTSRQFAEKAMAAHSAREQNEEPAGRDA
ncbi:unnamed protein product [Ixodes persulcatus]